MLIIQVVRYTVLNLLIAVLWLTGVQYKLFNTPLPLAGVAYLLLFHCKLVAHATYKTYKNTGVTWKTTKQLYSKPYVYINILPRLESS